MARNITDNEWQILNVLTCNRCNLKTSDMALLQAHHCPPRNQQITAGVSYNLVNAKFTCSLCTVELSESEFCEHLEGHLTLKPYVCNYCDRDFSTRDDVCDHLGSFHQQDEQIFVLKLTDRTKEIIQKAKHIGKVFYKPVNVLVLMSNNSAAVVIGKTLAQNLTTAAGQKQTKMKAPLANCSHLSCLGPTSTVHSKLPTAISPAQPQTRSVPTPSTSALQTQAPSCLSQNGCPPASDTSWRHPFAQKFPGQKVVPDKNLPMFLQGFNAQRRSIQRPATTLPNLVTHSLHSAAPGAAQNFHTRGVHIVTNASTTSVNHVKNAPALIVAPVFNLNQACLSSPSVQTTSGNQMASTSIPSLMNNISPSSTVTSNTHKAGNHLVPTVSPSPMKQSLAPAVIASTEENSPLMSADMSVHCQRHTETDAGNIYKVSIQQFPTEVKSGVESDNVKGDFSGNGSLQINQEASSLATEVIHEHSPAAVIKSEHSKDGVTDTPLQSRIENIMSLAAGQGDVQQCVQDNATGTVASTESSLPETGSNTTEHQLNTVGSSNFSFLHVIKGGFICLACQIKWYTDYDSFIKHIWEKHTHGGDFSCCPTGYSPYCARLEAIVKTIYDQSQEPMSDQIRSYFTPKSSIETVNEDVQNISSSESSSSAPVSSTVETVKQINVSESPSSTVPLRSSNAPNECEQILPAESISRSNESSSPPTTLVPDQHRHMIETVQNYEFGILMAGNELEKDVQESTVLLEVQPADTTDNQNTSSSCELRDDRHGNMRNIPDIDINCAADYDSGNQESCYTYIYEDISDDDCDDNNGHNRGTGSINYRIVDSPYSDELPLDLSKKTTQSEKSHNSVTVTPVLAAETAAVSSVTHIDKLSSERINNSHNNCTITLLPAAETAVTSPITQTAGLLPERVRKSYDNVTLTPLSATGTAVNPRTLTDRLKSSLAANSDIDAVSHFGCNMCQSEFADFDQLGLHLQESLLKANECKHCASFFLNFFSWKKHMAVEHVGLPRMYCIKRKRMCYECKMHSNAPQQISQEEIPCLSNVEIGAETSDYQCEGTHHESHATSGETANVLDEIETEDSHAIENSEVHSKNIELTETHSHHEGRDVADGIEAQTTHEHISKLPSSLDLVKTSAAMRSLISDVSLNAGKSERGAVAITGPNSNERRGNSVAQQCESGTYTTTINERSRSFDIDLHGLMRPVSCRGNNELREIVPDLTAIKASMSGNDGLMQIENSGNMVEYVRPVSKTSISIDSSNSVKSALSHAEDTPTNTTLYFEDLCRQEVVAKIKLGVQLSSHNNFGQTVSENISTLAYNMAVPLNDHCLNKKAECYVAEQEEAVSEISHSRVKHTPPSVVGNIDASSDLDQATSVESQDGCDVPSVSSSNTVSCKLPQASNCNVGSKDYFNITSTALSLPFTRVSDLASTSAANFNLDMAETRTILCVSEQNKLEHTESTCLPVEDIGADIDNRQESRHSSVVLENNRRSGIQHDIEHGISNVVKDGGVQAASAAVNGKSISRTVFLPSHTSTVGGNSIQEHQQTILVLPSCSIHHSNEAARNDYFVSVPSITDEYILSLQLENRQKPTKRSVVQQTVKGASVINQNFESAHDSETNINDLLREPYINNRSHCTPDVSSVLKTVSHDSGDIANPATNSLGPDHDSCHDIDFSSSKNPACTLQESVGDYAGNDDILENEISCGHDLLHLYIDKTSSNLTQDIETEKQETKKDGSYDKIHHNKNSLLSTKDGQLYVSNETSACIESRETHDVNVLNSPSHSDNFMEENNNTASVDQTSISSNITENKDSHPETNCLSDKVSTEEDLSNSLFRCNCSTLISCFTDCDHNVQPQDKSEKISFTSKCAKCRLVTEENLHPDNTTEHINSKTIDAVPSKDSKSLLEKKIENFMRALKRKISENCGKISQLEHVCGNHITRSKVDPPESSTIKPDVMSGHFETCVGPEISKTNPALKSDLETTADNGSIGLSESKNTARDFTTSNREMPDVLCKRESEAGQREGVTTSKLLRINSVKHNKSEDTMKKLDRAVAVSQSPTDIQGADVDIPDSALFRCSACPFVISQSYTELKQHVKSQHPQNKSARVCRIRSRSLQNTAELSERRQDAIVSLQEVQNNDVTMSCVPDGITTPQHAGINSEARTGFRAIVNKSEVNSESSHKIHKEPDAGIYKCIRPKCTFTHKWNPGKMKAHIKSKNPYYSCGYCKAPYTTLACLYKHIHCLHRSKKPRVMEGTITLDLLFKHVDIPYNGQGAVYKDKTSQIPAERKKRNQSSIIDDVKKSEATASSQLNVLKIKRHTPLNSCDVNVTSSQENQPLRDSKIKKTSKDNDDSHSTTSQGLKTPQCILTRSKSKSILEQISKDISPVPEHEVSSAEKPTVTSKTAAISNNDDSLSAKIERNLFKAAISSTFAKTCDHTHRMSPTVCLHAKKTVAPNATLLPSRSAENNTWRNKVTENQELDRHSSAQNVCSKMRPLGSVISQNTVRKDSSAPTSNHVDIVSLNSASVQSSGTVKQQELNSFYISDNQESSNRLGNVHETLPEILSETASCVSDTVLLRHTTTVASAIVTLKTQDKKHCGTWAAGQLEANTAAEGNENKHFVTEDLTTAHSENNLGMQHGRKTESKFENAPTTNTMSFSQHDYPFRCTVCGRILKCVRDIEKHYNRDHPRQDVRLTERKSGFVYLNSGKCLQRKDHFKAPTDSYLCSYCECRSMKRSDVEAHLKDVHPTHEVRVFTLCNPNTDRYSTRSKVTALPHEASSSSSPTPSYFCNVCSDVKYSEFQFRLHLASHPCYKHTTQLTAGASFLCHTCGYIAKSNRDFVQHTGEHLSERRFKCFMCEHDSHNKKSMRAHIKSVHNKTVDDDVGIIDRNKQRNVHLRPRLVNIDPQVVLIDPFRQPNYLQQLLLAHGIKTLDLTVQILSEVNKF